MADFNSDRQFDARRAFGDSEKSVEVHGKKMETFNVDIRKNGAMRNRALVLAALAGLCGAAGVAGASAGAPHLLAALMQSPHSLKIVSWAAIGGFGAAFVTTEVCVFERSIYDLELCRELWEIENHLAGELQEMICIYKNQGLSEEEAVIVTRIFAKQKLLFANLMMVEELGYSRLEPPTLPEAASNAGVPIVVGFVLGLVPPLMPVLMGGVRATGRATASTGSSLLSSSSGRSEGGGVTGAMKALSAAVLLLGGALVSLAQTEVFYGAYAQRAVVARTVCVNTVGIGVICALSYATARYL